MIRIKKLRWLAFSLLSMGVAGCAATTGIGTASSPDGKVRATFSWNAGGGRSGTMTAQVNNGQTYTGPFFQITRDTDVETLGWGWRRPWRGGWGDGYMTSYSGRVVANLEGTNGTHLRCQFNLVHPRSGMAGGGLGSCQLPDGQVIDANFPST